MKITRTKQIVVERERTISINTKDGARRLFCAECQKTVCFVKAKEAALICGITERKLFQAVEAGAIHFAETIQGELLVCSEILFDLMPPPNPLSSNSE